MAGKLEQYKKRRDFKKTPEPRGQSAKTSGRSFVVQKHAATRLHYDFRLEHEGVLKSWAVPKGPSLDPKERRLAVHVEDHPIEYGTFEGTIPKGQYGGGTVMVWDRGTWEPVGDANEGFRKGRLKFRLHGKKLKGGWSLIRMKSKDENGDKENWLLFKETDKDARPTGDYDITDAQPRSVATKRTIEQIAAAEGAVWESNRGNGKGTAKRKASPKRAATRKTGTKTTGTASATVDLAGLPGSRKRAQPSTFLPQLATLTATVPTGDTWIHEVKFDGYRMIAIVNDNVARMWTRTGKDWTSDMPEIAEAVSGLGIGSGILDGEVVVLKTDGTTDFQALQNSIKSGKGKLLYYAFDLPHCQGHDLTKTPLIERKAALQQLLEPAAKQGIVRYSDHILGQGQSVYDHACQFGMEGILCKRADAPYEQRRTRSWVKVKCVKRQEFVIGGYTDPAGSRSHFGALLLGYYDGGNLIYCGKVGTGFTETSLKELHRRLKPLLVESSPFDRPPPRREARSAHWVAPELVAEVEFTAWTDEGYLRHPSFKGLRDDKPASEIGRELANPPGAVEKTGAKGSENGMKQKPRGNGQAGSVAGITLSNPDRVLYPEDGITKLDLARFYETIQEWILPHVVKRPLTLVRCPQGSANTCFYQKHLTEGMPESLYGIPIQEKEGTGMYVAVKDLAGIIALVQIGALEIHPWGSSEVDVEKPDLLTIDLDPGPDVPWTSVIEAAHDVRRVLEEAGLTSFVKTTGGKGLHVVAPLTRRNTWDEAKEFAKAVAEQVHEIDPARFVTVMTKAKRKGKVYVDYLRNGRGATAIAAYSTRARPGAPVSTPLRWEELSEKTPPAAFTIRNLPGRLAKLKEDPWKGYIEVRQSITKKARQRVGMP